jgi:hypothetical protein
MKIDKKDNVPWLLISIWLSADFVSIYIHIVSCEMIHSYNVKYDEFQGWTMDNYIDEKSKATIEKMLQEEQYYLNGQNRRRNIRNLSSTDI